MGVDGFVDLGHEADGFVQGDEGGGNYELQITNYKGGETQKANERRSDGGAEARKGNAESRNAENVKHEGNRH